MTVNQILGSINTHNRIYNIAILGAYDEIHQKYPTLWSADKIALTSYTYYCQCPYKDNEVEKFSFYEFKNFNDVYIYLK